MSNKIRVFIFAIILIAISLANLIKPQESFSPSENRYLQTFPKFSWESFKTGKFNKEIDDFTNDQFIYRDTWVSMKSNLEILSGKLDNERVYFGKNGYLFTMDEIFNQVQFETNVKYINKFQQSNDNLDIDFILVPSKSAVLNQFLPSYAPVLDEKLIFEEIKNNIQEKELLNLFDDFANNDDLYFKTDHHWSSKGALQAYLKYTDKTLGKDLVLEEITLNSAFYGSEFRKANSNRYLPDNFSIFTNEQINQLNMTLENQENHLLIFDESKLETNDKYAYYQGGNHGLIKVKGHAGNGKKLLLLKDSFANSFIQYLSYDYDEIVMVDLRHFNAKLSELIEDQSFDKILFLYKIQTLVQDVNLSKLRR